VNSQKFNVMGEVQRSGSYPLSRPTRILDALAMAGGFRDFAKVKKIYVLRRTAQGANMQFPFDYKQVVKGRNSEQNIELEPGDTLVVP
jgi:polysaccharide export outer membrane protein